jgi:hydroxymethylpyrimidine pyrophosphatase-like HAD family hydrolase
MQNLKNSICLFDVDGTLTEPRRPINKQMLNTLRELSFQTEIGLLTGSGLEYIKEQLWPLLADQELSLKITWKQNLVLKGSSLLLKLL